MLRVTGGGSLQQPLSLHLCPLPWAGYRACTPFTVRLPRQKMELEGDQRSHLTLSVPRDTEQELKPQNDPSDSRSAGNHSTGFNSTGSSYKTPCDTNRSKLDSAVLEDFKLHSLSTPLFRLRKGRKCIKIKHWKAAARVAGAPGCQSAPTYQIPHALINS